MPDRVEQGVVHEQRWRQTRMQQTETRQRVGQPLAAETGRRLDPQRPGQFFPRRADRARRLARQFQGRLARRQISLA
ncbi:hypothetical protein LP419_27190 [Massilia sp. H-1]|nr:hypothetical protein LP419_27190 [Massilia sp. H-1]